MAKSKVCHKCGQYGHIKIHCHNTGQDSPDLTTGTHSERQYASTQNNSGFNVVRTPQVYSQQPINPLAIFQFIASNPFFRSQLPFPHLTPSFSPLPELLRPELFSETLRYQQGLALKARAKEHIDFQKNFSFLKAKLREHLESSLPTSMRNTLITKEYQGDALKILICLDPKDCHHSSMEIGRFFNITAKLKMIGDSEDFGVFITEALCADELDFHTYPDVFVQTMRVWSEVAKLGYQEEEKKWKSDLKQIWDTVEEERDALVRSDAEKNKELAQTFPESEIDEQMALQDLKEQQRQYLEEFIKFAPKVEAKTVWVRPRNDEESIKRRLAFLEVEIARAKEEYSSKCVRKAKQTMVVAPQGGSKLPTTKARLTQNNTQTGSLPNKFDTTEMFDQSKQSTHYEPANPSNKMAALKGASSQGADPGDKLAAVIDATRTVSTRLTGRDIPVEHVTQTSSINAKKRARSADDSTGTNTDPVVLAKKPKINDLQADTTQKNTTPIAANVMAKPASDSHGSDDHQTPSAAKVVAAQNRPSTKRKRVEGDEDRPAGTNSLIKKIKTAGSLVGGPAKVADLMTYDKMTVRPASAEACTNSPALLASDFNNVLTKSSATQSAVTTTGTGNKSRGVKRQRCDNPDSGSEDTVITVPPPKRIRMLVKIVQKKDEGQTDAKTHSSARKQQAVGKNMAVEITQTTKANPIITKKATTVADRSSEAPMSQTSPEKPGSTPDATGGKRKRTDEPLSEIENQSAEPVTKRARLPAKSVLKESIGHKNTNRAILSIKASNTLIVQFTKENDSLAAKKTTMVNIEHSAVKEGSTTTENDTSSDNQITNHVCGYDYNPLCPTC